MLRKKEKPEPLKVAFEVRLTRRVSEYQTRDLVCVKVEETLPPDVNPVDHIRRRVAEEITRQSGNFHEAEATE